MSVVYLRKLYNSLVPVGQEDMDALEKFAPNSVLKCEIKRPRNIGFHRKFFALLDVAFEAWECPVLEYKGQPISKNREQFRSDITILAGFYTASVNFKGEVRLKAQSISFASMKQDEFEVLYSNFVDVVLAQVLTSYTREELERVVSKILGFV